MLNNNLKGSESVAIKPHRLKKGDTIGVIAPASPPNQDNLKRSLSFLEELDLKVKMGDHVYDQYGYLAGKEEEGSQIFYVSFKGFTCKKSQWEPLALFLP